MTNLPADPARAPIHVGDVTLLLQSWRAGEAGAVDRVVQQVYPELRRLAQHLLSYETAGDLEATALVHELFLRLSGKGRPSWTDRRHFFAVAALIMRRYLVDRARRARSGRHGGDAVHVELSSSLPSASRPEELEALDEALDLLAQENPRRASIVDLKYFVGLTLNEVAEALSISQATVVREWRMARAWLYRELQGGQFA